MPRTDNDPGTYPRLTAPIPVRVLFIGMNRMFREALARLVNKELGFHVFAEAETAREGLSICSRDTPGIVVMAAELEDGDGIEATRKILQARPNTRIVLLQDTPDDDVTLRALRSGVRGVVRTNTPVSRLIEALRTVAQDRPYVAPLAWDVILKRIEKTPAEERRSRLASLSSRQRQILELVIQGKTTNKIAGALGLAVSTIWDQRKILMRKMDVKTTSELIIAALAEGFDAAGTPPR